MRSCAEHRGRHEVLHWMISYQAFVHAERSETNFRTKKRQATCHSGGFGRFQILIFTGDSLPIFHAHMSPQYGLIVGRLIILSVIFDSFYIYAPIIAVSVSVPVPGSRLYFPVFSCAQIPCLDLPSRWDFLTNFTRRKDCFSHKDHDNDKLEQYTKC